MLRLRTSTRRHLRSTRGCTVGTSEATACRATQEEGWRKARAATAAAAAAASPAAAPVVLLASQGPREGGAPGAAASRAAHVCALRACAAFRSVCLVSRLAPTVTSVRRGSCCPRRPPQEAEAAALVVAVDAAGEGSGVAAAGAAPDAPHGRPSEPEYPWRGSADLLPSTAPGSGFDEVSRGGGACGLHARAVWRHAPRGGCQR